MWLWKHGTETKKYSMKRRNHRTRCLDEDSSFFGLSMPQNIRHSFCWHLRPSLPLKCLSLSFWPWYMAVNVGHGFCACSLLLSSCSPSSAIHHFAGSKAYEDKVVYEGSEPQHSPFSALYPKPALLAACLYLRQKGNHVWFLGKALFSGPEPKHLTLTYVQYVHKSLG